MENKIELPKVYEIYDTTPEKFHKYAGVPKVSYSQLTSFSEELYRHGYYKQYFFKAPYISPFVKFSDFGSLCGGYLESRGTGKIPNREGLSDNDCNVLDNIELAENGNYEYETVIPFYEDDGVTIKFVLQGFIDELDLDLVTEQATVLDFKTGGEKKIPDYKSKKYKQTTLYSYYIESEEGFEILESKVLLLLRKGNGSMRYPLLLEGKTVEIHTPYTEKAVKEALAWVEKVTEQISDHYKVYKKMIK